MSASVRGVGRAPGKLILLGEHFVVHGAPALAVPLLSRSVRVEVIRAPDAWRVTRGREHLERMLTTLGEDPTALSLAVESTLPLGAGLGSSAALAVALVRALRLAEPADHEGVRALAHSLERLAHGNPSGIDDTVCTYARPVWFVRGSRPEPLDIPAARLPPLWVGVTGVGASTREAVAGVQRFKDADPARFEGLLGRARELAAAGRAALVAGERDALGAAMNANHALLQRVGVSCGPLDRLVEAAREAGAEGAKLTGGGLGGAMVAVAPPGLDLEPALQAAGAARVLPPAGTDTTGGAA